MKPVYKYLLLIVGFAPLSLMAQWQPKIGHLRPYDKTGINKFEDQKSDSVKWDGLKVKFGAGFTQQFQSLKVENPGAANSGTTNHLRPVTPGFQTAMANLYMDVQLADGIRLNVTSYMSSKHHNENWVKGGYIQFDKLPFKGKIWDDIMSVTTVKIGHFEINYGDEHFRRTDGGQAIYNPFMEGNIMDEFATEIGGEVYVQKNGLFGMMGVTNGMIKGYVDSATQGIVNGEVVDANTARNPSVYFKGGFDRQLSENLRVRLSGSYYHNSSSGGSGLTLFGGDRTGSNYQNVMELASTPPNSATGAGSAIAFSGRFNPSFSKKVDAVMLNGFLKAGGFEFFGTYETASGRTKTEKTSRTVNQYAVDGVYRFGKSENLFIGLRYNSVNAEIANITNKVTIDRIAAAAGWFLTKNVLLKAEYVDQHYRDFPVSDYRSTGRFHGYVVEAVVGF